MQLGPDDVLGFKDAYEREFGTTISDAEAQEMARRLADLFLLLATAPPKDPPDAGDSRR